MPTEEEIAEAVRRLQAELTQNAPAMQKILDNFDAEHAPEHHYEGNVGTAYGYMGKCSCGWKSAPKSKRRSAQGAVAAHIGQAAR